MRLFLLAAFLASPCLGAWSNTYTVAVDRTKCGASNLTNFPVLISIQNTALKTVANGGSVTSASGYDIVVATDSSIGTYVPWEVKKWDGTAGTWVGWALLSLNGSGAGSNSTFGFAIGNSAITTQQNVTTYAAANVWDANYKGVWHLGDGTTLNVLDSTSNANNGTNSGATVQTGACAGNCDGAADTTGGNHINLANTGFPSGAHALTMSIWTKGTNAGPASNVIFVIGNNGVSCQGADIAVVVSLQAGCTSHTQATGTSVANWTYAVLTYDGTTQRIYGNGVLANSSAQTYNIVLGHQVIGNDGFGNFYVGTTSEARLSNSVRSADWILTEYNNQSNPGNIGTPNFLIWSTPTASTVRHRVTQ